MQDCRRCHTGAGQIGVQTIVSLVHQGGVDAGAQLGVAHPLALRRAQPARRSRGNVEKSPRNVSSFAGLFGRVVVQLRLIVGWHWQDASATRRWTNFDYFFTAA